MAEETFNKAETATAAVAEVAVVPEAEKVEATQTVVCERDGPPEAEAETETEGTVKSKPGVVEEKEKEKEKETTDELESNVAGELPDAEKKALDELKELVREALIKHEFTAPTLPAEEKLTKEAKSEEEKAAAGGEEEGKDCDEKIGKNESTPPPASAEEEKATTVVVEESKACDEKTGKDEPVPPPETAEVTEEEKATTLPPPVTELPVPGPCVDDDGAKQIEAIQETVVAVTTTASSEAEKTEETEQQQTPPEEVSIWGIPLLADSRSDVVLLKFLRARDFKVKEAFTMLKNVVTWRKEFGIESLLQEDLGTEQEKVVYMNGVDKEGHPVCYNAYGEYQNKELYNETFSTEEKRTKFLRWRIQFLEKSIRKLDFSPDGICTIVQVIDFKNSPGPFKWELRQATNQALQLFQDNYPEFVAKQVFINVPLLYLAFYKIINPFFTQRTKSKFVFAGPSKTAETLFMYIAPELVPVQYGGLSREGEQEFTSSDSVTEEIIKPATKHTIEFPAPEACTLAWEARVVGSEVTYGAEFVPAAADSYTVIVHKSRKVAAMADEPVISGRFKCEEPGKVVLTFNNQASKKKKVLYRTKKTKVASD